MKQTKAISFDFDLAANATGFAAIALACTNVWEKIKSIFSGGSHGHSGIHGTGSIHVEISTCTEFTPEEAEIGARLNQESFDNLSKNMNSLIDASRQYCEFIRDESGKSIKWFYNMEDEMDALSDANSEKSEERYDAREAKREAKRAKAAKKSTKDED